MLVAAIDMVIGAPGIFSNQFSWLPLPLMETIRSFPDTSPRASPFQFRLRSLLLVMTWLAACLCLAKAVPVLGIVAAVLTVPAIARTWRSALQSEAAGWPASTAEVADTFLWSVVLLITIAVAWALVAVAAACTASLAAMTAIARSAGVPAAVMTYVAHHSKRLLAWLASLLSRQVGWVRMLVSRKPGLMKWFGVAALLPSISISVVLAAGLAVVSATAALAAFLSERIIIGSKMFRWLERQVLGGLHKLLKWKTHLVRSFSASSSGRFGGSGACSLA